MTINLILPHGGKLINKFTERNCEDLETFEVSSDTRSDAENIATGVFSPLEGFMSEDDFLTVLKEGRLSNSIPWTIPIVLDKEKFFRGNGYVEELRSANIDFIVLAGFLWKVPNVLIKAWHGKMINIHPALLPNYGGKGMYGRFVHETVIANKDKESGITIHYVDEVYDHGQIILQATCVVSEDETPESLAKKVQLLEHRHFPAAVALLAACCIRGRVAELRR